MKKIGNYVINKEKGITIISLVITIIVVLLILGIVIRAVFGEDGLIDKSVKTRFITDFKQVEESVRIYAAEKQIDAITGKQNNSQIEKQIASAKTFRIGSTIKNTNKTEDILPVKTMLTTSEKEIIKKDIPTLAETIKILTSGKKIDQRTLYWIDLDKINLKMNHKYIIDAESMQLYDYEGERFSGNVWHVPEIGINKDDINSFEEIEDDIWDGWITLTLYYPEDAVERKWRLSEEGETRYDENLAWEDYTGSITVRLSQVENIWIKYKIGNEEIIIPPLGKLLVDIEVSPTGGKRDLVKVKINYDKDAQAKQYRVNGGEWKDYEGEFEITENVLIEAKGEKEESVYDENGTEISKRKVTGRDAYFIRNIGVEEVTESLTAPTIERIAPDTNVEGEVARVKITYPEVANEKIYKENYGKENTYTDEISIKKYGTEILAYYRTQEGKKSKCSLIIINGNTDSDDPSSSDSNTWSKPSTYIPSYWGTTQIPFSESLAGPNISVTYGTDNQNATIRISTAKVARKIYVQLGNEKYKEYTDPITVTRNMTVRAYYISEEDGETSKTSYARVSGIHQEGKPWVTIDANPYPYGNSSLADKVTVTISSSESEMEYSYDGIVYEKYTGTITITQNSRIYARATNEKGTTEEYLDITNIGNTPPVKREKLSVNINVNPEPSITTSLVDKVKVSIEYDQKATGKYYSIGRYGAIKEYTGEFEVTSNCTIYAYATNDNGSGQATKIVDNITTGIAEPIISASPTNGQQSAKTKITITFDKTATTKRYEINGSGLRDYIGEFEVAENCTIRAVNKNSLGQSSETTYVVDNIVSEPPKLLLDKGDYYLLKLPFPEISSGREYKYKENGEWKSYPEEGIILIKPEKKDAVVKDNKIIIKIEDENGNKTTFTGDWYLLDVPINEIFEHISMRWDRKQPNQPTIILDTTEPTKKVKVTINYDSNLVKKEYNILYPDGTRTGWKKYTEEIEIDQKGTVIYARGMDESETYSPQAIKKITNIDEEAPTIKLTADLENAQQKVGIKVQVIDDVKVEQVKYAVGILGESYFTNDGTEIENNSVVTIEENGYYTFYAIDGVGNKQVYTLNIGNIDKTPPVIDIQVSPENTIGLESKITIDYGDSTTKQYKVGQNGTYKNYTGEITLTSNDVIAANAVNDDYTVTIYAKGQDSVGNPTEVSKKILNLDLDAPNLPVINSNYGYPILTEYGVKYDGETTITYDTRKDITNYYSTDNGETWNIYTGTFTYAKTGTIIAKSVKKSGLEATTTKTIKQPSNALGTDAYDNNPDSSVNAEGGQPADIYTVRYLYVSSEMWNKRLNLKWKGSQVNSGSYNSTMEFLSDTDKLLDKKTISGSAIVQKDYDIPSNTRKIKFTLHRYMNFSYGKIYEIRPTYEPEIVLIKNYYPMLTNNGVEYGYCMVDIKYFMTSVQRLYKIDDGSWKNYPDRKIKLEEGQTIYAKGIDKNGKESNIVSLKSNLISDALPRVCYNGNSGSVRSPYVTTDNGTISYYLAVSSEMYNKQFNITGAADIYSYATEYRGWIGIRYLKSDKSTVAADDIWISESSINKNYTIPNETEYIKVTLKTMHAFNGSNCYAYLYKIKLVK